MLPLLDLHSVRRVDFHVAVMEVLFLNLFGKGTFNIARCTLLIKNMFKGAT